MRKLLLIAVTAATALTATAADAQYYRPGWTPNYGGRPAFRNPNVWVPQRQPMCRMQCVTQALTQNAGYTCIRVVRVCS
jgi:hypothetical protein